MKKWFKELQKDDVIAQSKLKVRADNTCYFDDNDLDYFRIDDIKNGDIITTSLQTNQSITMVCGVGWDEWAKQPAFEIVGKCIAKEQQDIFDIKQLSLFDFYAP